VLKINSDYSFIVLKVVFCDLLCCIYC